MSLRSNAECLHVFGSAATNTIALVAAISTQRVYVYRLIVTIATPGISLMLQDTANNALSQAFQLANNGTITLDTPINGDPWWSSGTGLGVQFSQGAGTTMVGYDVYYLQGQ